MRVLFLPRYGRQAGSSRYMSYDFLPYYEEAGIQCDIHPLLDDTYLKATQAKRSGRPALSPTALRWHLLRQSLGRIAHTLQAGAYDAVVLEKDLIPNLPFALEHLLFRLNRRVVVMYDESTHANYAAHPNRFVQRATSGKIERIMRAAAHVVAWNPEVEEFARRLNPNVTVVSTGIDMKRYVRKPANPTVARTNGQESAQPVRIGWIGSPSGLDYVHGLDSVFTRLAATHPIQLLVVSSEDYVAQGVSVDNRRWSLDSEIADLQAMDIGIMPLPQNEWASGKSGCKMFQYMGVGVPVVVSPVGINGKVVDDGVNGFVATSDEEWYRNLERLIVDAELRTAMGGAGRQYVEAHNSQAAVAEKLIGVLRSVAMPERAEPLPA